DVGRTGANDSVIGKAKRAVLERFRTGLNKRMEVGKDDVRLCGVTLDIDEANGRARRIQRFALSENQK
ncbi:MAG: YmdB family metallophosphoesterase, partial [Acidobacteria bacterium]|nr:YmdB family metallophosphoesterase [Acidobacteriota bacterium]